MKQALFSFAKYSSALLLAAALFSNSISALAASGDFTAVTASGNKVKGLFQSDLSIELTGRYNAGAMNADGGSAEIVVYDNDAGCMYVVNGLKGTLDRVPMGDLTKQSNSVISLPGVEINVADLLASKNFAYGDMTSVAVKDGLVAVAVQAKGYADRGRVAVFDSTGKSLRLAATFMTGVQPDMLTFTPDGNKLLVANEGEPRMGVEGVDPAGGVTIVNLNRAKLADSTSTTIGFGDYDKKRAALVADGVVLRKNTKPSTDLEPEYIALSQDGKTAYVALQEANSIATLDVEDATFTGVYGLGVKNFGTKANALDLLKDDKISIEPQPGVYGLYMPDGIAVHQVGKKTYLLTANEGDSRADWPGLDEEVEAKTSPTGNVTLPEEVVWYNANLYDGLTHNRAYIFGGRSFALWEMTGAGPVRVFDSGSDFERLTSKVLPKYFNCSNDDISLDDRSGKKGVEPEYVTTGTVGDRTYAFIGLERVGGVMVYDITDIKNITFSNYINSREFGANIQGDVAPEGLCFIPASQSVTGNAQILAAGEVSGTVAIYEMK